MREIGRIQQKFGLTKWIAVSIIGGWLLGACNNNKPANKYVIGFSQCTAGDSWRQSMHSEMEREMALHPELELVIFDAEGDSEKQKLQLQELIERKVDLLIVSPNESAPITPLVEEIYYQGTPIIVLDRKTDSELYTAYVGGDNFEIGKTAGNYVAQKLKGKGKIVEIWGLPSSSPAIDRHQGFAQTLSSYPDLTVVGEINGKWERNFVELELPGLLAKNEEVDLIYAHNDRMAFGAYQVCKQLGLEDKIQIIGIDGLAGSDGGLQLVENGILSATFLYPTGGQEAIQIAEKILMGEEYQKKNILYSTVIDSSNVYVMNSQYDKIMAQRADIQRQNAFIEKQAQIYRSQQTLLYVLLISLLISLLLGLWLFKSLKDKQAINRDLEIKNKEISENRNKIQAMAEQTKEANLAKIRFFTNISHEFRTPLTLILGPIEDLLLNEAKSDRKLSSELELVKTNAKRLLRLVNQLMDFRKIENQKMKPQWKEVEIVAFVQQVISSFSLLARKKGIELVFSNDFAEKCVWFDPNMLDKVLFNLLSNALKFTPSGGHIRIFLEEKIEEGSIQIQVQDTGIGMSEEEIKHVFNRYYQGEKENKLGTGLGLSLSKELMNLHNGDLRVDSSLGKGATFVISLPLTKPNLPDNYEILDEGSSVKELWELEEVGGVEALSTPIEQRKDAPLILLVEDNEQVRAFMKARLDPFYRVLEAVDGQMGLGMAFGQVPDLIICDVALPELDGISLAQVIKKDVKTSHIPVIILTARDAIQQQIEGMQAGADVYLTKPFNSTFLLKQVESLLKNRKVLRDRIFMEIKGSVSKEQQSPGERRFINQFIALVEENYQDPNFSVQDISRELGLSRVQVYRKVKQSLGYSVSDYLKEIRLKKASHLLRTTQQSVAEIAYAVGFSSPAYFSTVFKSHFDTSPTHYKEKAM